MSYEKALRAFGIFTTTDALPTDAVLQADIGTPFRVPANAEFTFVHIASPKARKFFNRRAELSGRLSLIEQAAFARARDQQQDTSSAQPHRFRSAP